MRKIIFLDFDGVLHGEFDAHFARLGLFEQYLRRMPEVEIVISSTWREDDAIEKLRQQFDVSLRDRITGVTPSLECGYEPGGRQSEIEAFLDSESLDSSNASWVALDDMKFFFDEGCQHLILVDPDFGFRDEDGEALLKWYANDA